MSRFQIISQDGYFNRKILSKSLPPTPWILENSSSGFTIADMTFKHIKLLEDRIIDLSTSKEVEGIPNYSILSPLLKPARDFPKSIKYELDTFLDRIEFHELPDVYGIVYDEIYGKDFLGEIIKLSPSIIVIQGINHSSKHFSSRLMKLRQEIPFDIAIYLAGDIPIGLTNLVFACGVDIIDDTSCSIASFLYTSFADGFIRRTRRGRDALLEENLHEMRREAKGIANSEDIYGRLNRASHTSPHIATHVRRFLRSEINLQNFNLTTRRKLHFINDNDLYHPIVRAYQKRMLDTYTFPKGKQLLLLLPCSAKKPYSESKSHRFFNKIVRNAFGKGRVAVEIWSLTSPLGAVPRELENIFPASDYDIPVSGDWSEEESNLTGNFLRQLLEKVPTDIPVVAHLSSGYRTMFEKGIGERNGVFWFGSKPTSHEAGNILFRNLKEYSVDDNRSLKLTEKLEKIEAIIRWQFGKEFEIKLDDLSFRGFAPKPIQVSRKGKHWLSWDSLKGTVKLSIDAISESNLQTEKTAIVMGDISKSSTIFRPGIVSIGQNIAPGDEVILFNEEGELLGVGTSLVSSHFVRNMTGGSVIKIRKKLRRKKE